jgi:type IV pilus assembly protein PilC
MKKKIKKALTYPSAVIIVAFIVTAILLLFVVPVFEDLFKSFGADLPIFTRMIVDMSKALKQIWWLVLGIIFAVIYIFIYFKKRSPAFNRYLDRILLKIPVIGTILNKSAIARFARTLSTLSAAGIPLVNALQSVSGSCGNIMYSEAVLKMREEVATGQRLQYAMLQTMLFPHMVQQMIAIGEESGSMDAMLAKVADFYEEEVDNLVDNLSSLMEPMIMVVLGVLIGGLVVAMYLPIFKMGAAIN